MHLDLFLILWPGLFLLRWPGKNTGLKKRRITFIVIIQSNMSGVLIYAPLALLG